MGKLERSIVVACPPPRVFDVLADVEQLVEFSGMTIEVRKGPGRPLQTGDRFEQVVKILGKELDSEWQAVEVVSPSLLRFEGTAPAGASATLVERITPEGDGSRVELVVDYEMPLGILGDAIDAVYLHSKHEEQAEEILSALKARCEAGS